MKKATIILVFAGLLIAQTIGPVVVRGIGKTRDDAIRDALRNAVEQALGTIVKSEAEVQNFSLIKDVIRTRAEGYVSKYDVVKETPFPDRYEVEISALVSRAPIDADMKSLSERMGGVRFMVYFDPDVTKCERELLEYTQDRINEYISNKGYRYAEPEVVRRLIEEARELSGTSNLTKAQEIAYAADAEFYIDISKLLVTAYKKALGIYTADAIMDLKLYDAGTAEGVTALTGETDTVSASFNLERVKRMAIDKVVKKAGEKLVYRMAKRFGEWLNTGYPYQLRFYGIESYRTLRKLKKKLKEDERFGGQMDIKFARGYGWINITFKGTADELTDAVLDYADEIAGFPEIDVKLIVFNQINFATTGAVVPQPELEKKAEEKGIKLPRRK